MTATPRSAASATANDSSDVSSSPTRQGEVAQPRPPKPLIPNWPHIPLCFFGLAVYRSWIDLLFVAPAVEYPATALARSSLFDYSMLAVLLACAALARKIGPFYHRGWVYNLACLLLVGSSLLSAACLWFHGQGAALSAASAVFGGSGVAIVILMWSELYGCLGTLKVALYYSASIIATVFIVSVCRQLNPSWLLLSSILFPIIALRSAAAGFRTLPQEDLPDASPTPGAFPWKIVLLMALYEFAYGFSVTGMDESLLGAATMSSPGTIFAAGIVIIGVLFRGERYDFGSSVRITLALLVAAFLVLQNAGLLSREIADFCWVASYEALSILVMLILANLCYRYKVSAIWLFGISRGVRALFASGGVLIANCVASAVGHSAIASTVVIAIVIVASIVLLSEQDFPGRWGLAISEKLGPETSPTMTKRQEAELFCAAVSEEYELTAREREVIILLAQGKTTREIEQELFIAAGTVKTHTRNIYQKLNLRSREELVEMLTERTSDRGQ